jgi:hypothetical protein
VPRLVQDPRLEAPRPGAVVLRSWIEDRSLARAEELPRTSSSTSTGSCRRSTSAGVPTTTCTKEQTSSSAATGCRTWSTSARQRHAPAARAFASRAREDLRRRSTPPTPTRAWAAGRAAECSAARARPPPALVDRAWKRGLKPLYELLTRRAPPARDGEERAASGPWPRWTPPLGARRELEDVVAVDPAALLDQLVPVVTGAKGSCSPTIAGYSRVPPATRS